MTSASASYSTRSSSAAAAAANSPGAPASASSSSSSSSSSVNQQQVDLKDKYMLFYWYANAAFNLREYKLAESLFYKALQMNKSFSSSNGRSKAKTLATLDSDTDIQIKFNLYLCLFYDKKYQEAYMIVINYSFFPITLSINYQISS